MMIKLEGTSLTIAVNAALVFAQVSFGAFHVIGGDALQYVDPIVFAFYREIISGPALVLIAIVLERVKPNIKADWWRFILLGMMLYLNQLLFIEGLALTSATLAAIMQPCIPVFTTFLTLVLRMEKVSVLKVLGILICAGGAVALVGFDGVSLESKQTQGLFCLIGNTFAMSVYYIIQKPVVKKYPPISLTGWAYIVASVAMGFSSLFDTHGVPSAYELDHRVYFPLAYATVFATILAYIAVTFANSHIPASIVAAYNCLQPFAAAILSYIFNHQTPTVNEYIGAAAIIIGLAVVTLGHLREVKKEAPPAGGEVSVSPSGSPSSQRHQYQPINSPETFHRLSFHTSELILAFPPPPEGFGTLQPA